MDSSSKPYVLYGDVIRSIFHAMEAGLKSFRGYDLKRAISYFERVSKAFQNNIWIKPTLDLDIGERLPEI